MKKTEKEIIEEKKEEEKIADTKEDVISKVKSLAKRITSVKPKAPAKKAAAKTTTAAPKKAAPKKVAPARAPAKSIKDTKPKK